MTDAKKSIPMIVVTQEEGYIVVVLVADNVYVPVLSINANMLRHHPALIEQSKALIRSIYREALTDMGIEFTENNIHEVNMNPNVAGMTKQ